jgi:DNA-binding beta-propeller fold protein YncE
MSSDGMHDPQALTGQEPGAPISTRGALARSRRLRIAVLATLGVCLAVLSYAAYYYTVNRRLPIPQVVAAADTKVDAPRFLYAFAGTAKQAMTKPTGIGIVGDRVFVTDFAWRTVRAYSRDGRYLFDFGPISDGKITRLNSPVHIAVAPDHTVWVTDRALHGIYVFDQDGTFLRKFIPNADTSFKWSPLAIAIGADGTVYVSDVANTRAHRILVFSSDGALRAEWGRTAQVASTNDAPGDFLFPNGITVTGTGANAVVFVADGDNRRVQVFHADGSLIRIIPTSGTPRGLVVDSAKRLYVVDALAHRIDLYSEAGVALTGFGENGVGPGQFNFPNDVVLDDQGRIFVTDRDNNQVQVWAFPAAEIPGVTIVTPGSIAWLLVPLPFLLLPVVLRRRRFVAAPDFIDGMVAAGLLGTMAAGRYRWLVPEHDAAVYSGVAAGGVGLDDLLHAEPYSITDAGIIRDRLSVDAERAGLLAMAKRARVLCTEDPALARQAISLGIDVYDRASWLERFAKKRAGRV